MASIGRNFNVTFAQSLLVVAGICIFAQPGNCEDSLQLQIEKRDPKALSERDFWWIIELSREDCRGDRRRQLSALRESLGRLSPNEVAAFHAHFYRAIDEANTWDCFGSARRWVRVCGVSELRVD
jgi:hypothetical protein